MGNERWIACAGAGLLLLATLELPYGYYTFLRFAVSVIAVLLAVLAVGAGRPSWLFGLVPVTLLWNPLIPVYLTREAWLPLDLLGAALFAIYAFANRPVATKRPDEG